MSHDPSEEYDFDFDPLGEDYPLPDEVDSPTPSASTDSVSMEQAEEPSIPASQRIETLFREMKVRRRVLLDILRFLDTPHSAADLGKEVDRLQEYDYSVFTAANYSDLLEEAGAIAKCDVDGGMLGEDFKQQPEIVEVDGEDFYKPADTPKIFWETTDAGREYLASDKPFERLLETIDNDKPEYTVVYQRILHHCDIEGGRATDELAEFVKTDADIADLGVYAARFTDRLEKCNALQWQGTWRTTDIGRQGLDHYNTHFITDESEA